MTHAQVAKFLALTTEEVQTLVEAGTIPSTNGKISEEDLRAAFECPADVAGAGKAKVTMVVLDNEDLYVGNAYPSKDPADQKKRALYARSLPTAQDRLRRAVCERIQTSPEGQAILERANKAIAGARKLHDEVIAIGEEMAAAMEDEAPDFRRALEQSYTCQTAMSAAHSKLTDLRHEYSEFILAALASVPASAQEALRKSKAKRALWQAQFLGLSPEEAAGRALQIDALTDHILELEITVHAAQHVALLTEQELRLPSWEVFNTLIGEIRTLLKLKPLVEEKPPAPEKPPKRRRVPSDSRLGGQHAPSCQCAVCVKAREDK